MLVIRRRQGEAIRIGEDVSIEIIECGPNRVKLGVRAPKEIPVWRAEVQTTREQNIVAATWSRASLVPCLSTVSGGSATAAVMPLETARS